MTVLTIISLLANMLMVVFLLAGRRQYDDMHAALTDICTNRQRIIDDLRAAANSPSLEELRQQFEAEGV